MKVLIFNLAFAFLALAANAQPKCDTSAIHIKGVFERRNDGCGYEHYFLTSQGKRIDSLDFYVYDNGIGVQHEGFIRYRHLDSNVGQEHLCTHIL